MLYLCCLFFFFFFFFFQAEDGIRDAQESRGLGDVYKRQVSTQSTGHTDFETWLLAAVTAISLWFQTQVADMSFIKGAGLLLFVMMLFGPIIWLMTRPVDSSRRGRTDSQRRAEAEDQHFNDGIVTAKED
eukprot:TRINITY_DN996_c0_g1_i2.p2 TRINITY_DN996_c0_g1~~TRINITY_DN996_c0_g1_i2.p2  ORF type:complete len:130 (-),score=52.86 TRINITY_DN996_c0_g1_i2:585-974(-)